MAELTAEQLAKAETMSLAELRELAMKEAEPVVEETVARVQQKDAKGRFTSNTDEETLDNSEDNLDEEEEEKAATVYRKEIDLGDGSGVQVFEGDTIEELVDKLADAQKNATKKIRELSKQVKTETVRTEQQQRDDEYVVTERLKKEPTKAIKDIVAEVIAERESATAAWKTAQERFVQTHTDFIPNPDNGRELMIELERLNAGYSYDGLEKAYQSLKARGILKLKVEESEEATEDKAKETTRIEPPKVEATQPRSQKKGSTVSITRTKTVTPASTQPSEDELYQMPLEKLRELANKQLGSSTAE